MEAKLNETYDAGNDVHSGASTASTNNDPNSTYTKEPTGAGKMVNTTVTSYDITPARHELPPEELVDEDNYDIGDLRSDEDTDDEDNPRKQIPKWAQGKSFTAFVFGVKINLKQFYNILCNNNYNILFILFYRYFIP